MPYLIRVLGFANGEPCPHAGHFLMRFDHEAHDGFGEGWFTTDPVDAKRFATAADALRFWNRRSKVRPTRPDGKPNKPFTASSCEVVRLDQIG